jgi:hypothetical protein
MTPVRSFRLRPIAPIALLAVAAVAAGCTGTSTPSAVASALTNASLPPVATQAPTEVPTAAASESATESPAASIAEASESALPSAVATDIDPCQLITADEAGKLVGAKFGAGRESTAASGVKLCAYSAPGPNIFTVQVAIAPDEATAKAAEAATEQDLDNQAAGNGGIKLAVTKLPNFQANTDAVLLEGAAQSPIALDARAIYLLRGTSFFGFSDIAVGGKAPTADAMKQQATTTLAKLP